MSAERLVARGRRFLLLMASALCSGVIVELWLTDHMEEWLQLVPFALCGLGLLASLAVLIRPQPNTIRWLRLIMIVSFLGGVLGVYEHLEGNYGFAQEINAALSNRELWWEALTGANPPFAPAALGVSAVLAVAATYYHPAAK